MDNRARIGLLNDLVCGIEDDVTVAFSGGKDSSAVLRLIYSAIIAAKRRPSLRVLYCDTGVENPIIDGHVQQTLASLASEMKVDGLKGEVVVARPQTYQAFFVRVIGRGYPPPTNSFRWCTKDLRIRPVQKYLRSIGSRSLVLLGSRRGESQQRDRSIERHANTKAGTSSTQQFYQTQQSGSQRTRLFLPIIDYSLEDVWACLFDLSKPHAIDNKRLAQLYKEGGGECPAIREFKDKPCARARFGCWVCTVVRRDKSAENLISAGHEDLVPLQQFREWLLHIRNQGQYRCKIRRNGTTAPGPLTLAARKLILERLVALESRIGRRLIDTDQISLIKALWQRDSECPRYMASE